MVSRLSLVVMILLAVVPYALAEEDSVSFATYYPAPYGVYNEMRINKMVVGDASSTAITTMPSDGSITFKPSAQPIDYSEGTLYYDNSSHEFKYRDDAGWNDFSGAPNYATTIWTPFSQNFCATDYTAIGVSPKFLEVDVTTHGLPVLLLADINVVYHGPATWTYFMLKFARDGVPLDESCQAGFSSIGGERDTESLHCIDINPPAGHHTYSAMYKQVAGDCLDFNWLCSLPGCDTNVIPSRITAIELH